MAMRKYKTTGNTTLFDKEDTERKLTEMGDPLERLSKVVDFEMFRAELEDALLEESDEGQPLFADGAYVGQEETLEKYKVKDEICEKGYRGHSLTEEQRERNREKSRTRCRVEHIFGFMENTMHRLYIRTVGLARATAVIGLINLTYNMSRYEQIVRLNLLKTN